MKSLALLWARAEVDYTVHVATADEIAENDYCPDVGVYVEDEDTSEHLMLAEIQERLEATVKREAELRAQIDSILREAGVMCDDS